VFKKLRELTVNLTVYGVGDVAVQLASFLLLPLYTIILSPTENGAIALLLIVEQVMRVVNRWGVDASFMRFYYDCPDDRARRELASTIFFFLLAAS
jgi:O-antigen/teichoic acid export membrane protein